jgi:hypothetical protein
VKSVFEIQEEMAKIYKYKSLPSELSINMRQIYLNDLNIFGWISLDGDDNSYICTLSHKPISYGYNRIVIGDYGAFIEIKLEQIMMENLKVKEGQEYRIENPKYSNTVKYYWFTAKDDSNIKIYYQRRFVNYADYRPNMFYVSPYEVTSEGPEL